MDAGDVTDRDHYHRLFFAYGTPNCVEHGSICDTPRRHGPESWSTASVGSRTSCGRRSCASPMAA